MIGIQALDLTDLYSEDEVVLPFSLVTKMTVMLEVLSCYHPGVLDQFRNLYSRFSHYFFTSLID